MASSNSIGIEIKDRSIKFAELASGKNGFKLGNFGEIPLPESLIEKGFVKKAPELRKILANFRKKIKGDSFAVSFFPDQVFLSDILSEAGFKNPYFEGAGASLSRLVRKIKGEEAAMIVYAGEERTEIFVSHKKETDFLSMLPFGRKIFEASGGSELILSFLAEKIDEQFVSWHTHEDKDHAPRPLIGRIVLSGELPDLSSAADYLGLKLRVSVDTLKVWEKILDFEEHLPEMNNSESLYFSVPIGLAYRKFEK